MRNSVWLCSALAALALCGSASAAERTATQRQTLIALAQVLGQSHALRQACDPDDQTWRSWMSRLLEREKPAEDFDRRLRESFNGGYHGARNRFTACDAATRAETQRAAERGRALTRQLGS